MVVSMVLCCTSAFYLHRKEDALAEHQQFVRVEEAQTVFEGQRAGAIEMSESIN
jgi:hypothetical protein